MKRTELPCLGLALQISHPASVRGMEWQAASAKLESLVKELELKLQTPAAAELRKLQAEWREHRNRDCDWERGAFADGSVGPLVYSSCLAARSGERIQRLKILLCEGGGMTGPCAASRRY